jgi:hypothetical protein
MYELLINKNALNEGIVFQGPLTIQNANLIKKCLSDAIEKVNILSIDHHEATMFDITYLQILITLHYSAIKSGKTIKLIYSKSFVAFVKDSGLSGYEYLLNGDQYISSKEDDID